MIKTGLFYPFTFTSCNHQNSETHQTRIIQYKALDQLTQNDCLLQERLDNYLKISILYLPTEMLLLLKSSDLDTLTE